MTVSNPTITLSGTSFEYTGEAIKPTVTVKDGSTTIPASEYTVSYSNNKNVGMATVTITDMKGGNYTVSGSATFEIGLKGDANGDNKVDASWRWSMRRRASLLRSSRRITPTSTATARSPMPTSTKSPTSSWLVKVREQRALLLHTKCG